MNTIWKALFERNQYRDGLCRAEGFSNGYQAACDETLERIARHMHHVGFADSDISKALELPLDTVRGYCSLGNR